VVGSAGRHRRGCAPIAPDAPSGVQLYAQPRPGALGFLHFKSSTSASVNTLKAFFN
jgi:hypothetical protein